MNLHKREISDVDWSRLYSDADATWSSLYQYQMRRLQGLAHPLFWDGMRQLAYCPEKRPDLEKTRDFVFKRTGWTLVSAEGEVPARDFMKMLSRKQFPLVWKLRPINQIFATGEPDLWHELIGHVPMLFSSRMSDFYYQIGLYANNLDPSARQLEELIRFYWFFAEYGLIQEGHSFNAFGAALLGSPLVINAFQHRQLKIKELTRKNLLKQVYNLYSFQKNVFYLPSIEAAFSLMEEIQT